MFLKPVVTVFFSLFKLLADSSAFLYQILGLNVNYKILR